MTTDDFFAEADAAHRRRAAVDAAWQAYEISTRDVALAAKRYVESVDSGNADDADWELGYLRRRIAEQEAARGEWDRLVGALSSQASDGRNLS